MPIISDPEMVGQVAYSIPPVPCNKQEHVKSLTVASGAEKRGAEERPGWNSWEI